MFYRLSVFAVVIPLVAATPPKPTAAKRPAADIVASVTGEPSLSRTIAYDEHDIPTIHTRLHYTTVFVLPKDEKIMDLLCGHQEQWTVNGADGTNFAYIRPDKAGARTNLNLVAASGNVYSFLLAEGEPDAQPDLKVFVEAKDTGMAARLAARPRWVLASELERASERAADADARAADAKNAAGQSVKDAQAASARDIAAFRTAFPSTLRYDYRYKARRGFDVRAIAHDKEFTYIWASPQEAPTLYEVKDGKPALIAFSYAGGVYIAPKVLDEGYLAIGKHKLEFRREGE